jgi:hypothetical protein
VGLDAEAKFSLTGWGDELCMPVHDISFNLLQQKENGLSSFGILDMKSGPMWLVKHKFKGGQDKSRHIIPRVLGNGTC